MPTVLIQAEAGILPEGFCPRGEGALQEYYVKMLELARFSLNAANGLSYNLGNVKPTPENQVYPWFRTSGGYPDRWYYFAGGQWLAKHPLPPGFTTIAPASITSAADLNTYDEGNAGAVTIVTGPFWEIDTDFDGRSPMGVGAIPSSNPAKTLSVNEAFGEGAHLMTEQEVGPHTHVPSPKEVIESGSGDKSGLFFVGPSGNSRPDLAIAQNTYTSGQQTMPVIHPVRARYIIKRTARLFYAVP